MLDNKVILVTGSTTGIGREIARQCVAQGARVLIHGRDRERGEALCAELGSENTTFCAADLADPSAAPQLVQIALDAFGRIDAVVNNAAAVTRSDIHSTDQALFDRIMAINVRAPFLLIQAALPQLIANQGCVANIGSVNGMGGEMNLLAYSISKGALQTLSKNLANALGTQLVRVLHFNVGWVLTEN
jgi:NAD(P)-dependent dehydrogenase (short-subunit alcohol dehydrogenase family)